MSRTLRILERARTDVEEVFNWLVHRSVPGAISWYFAFGRTVERIVSSPEAFGEAAEAVFLDQPLREALFKTRRGRVYRIVFQLSDTEILILRVRGPAQPRLQQRDLPSP